MAELEGARCLGEREALFAQRLCVRVHCRPAPRTGSNWIRGGPIYYTFMSALNRSSLLNGWTLRSEGTVQ
jgi:hypothetical protein